MGKGKPNAALSSKKAKTKHIQCFSVHLCMVSRTEHSYKATWIPADTGSQGPSFNSMHRGVPGRELGQSEKSGQTP